MRQQKLTPINLEKSISSTISNDLLLVYDNAPTTISEGAFRCLRFDAYKNSILSKFHVDCLLGIIKFSGAIKGIFIVHFAKSYSKLNIL
jgi:hypothetical protein